MLKFGTYKVFYFIFMKEMPIYILICILLTKHLNILIILVNLLKLESIFHFLSRPLPPKSYLSHSHSHIVHFKAWYEETDKVQFQMNGVSHLLCLGITMALIYHGSHLPWISFTTWKTDSW